MQTDIHTETQICAWVHTGTHTHQSHFVELQLNFSKTHGKIFPVYTYSEIDFPDSSCIIKDTSGPGDILVYISEKQS